MPDNRRYPKRPILGVGALIFQRGKILLIERGKQPLKGYWSLPGGALEIGETLEQGVIREVREETGLIVKPVKAIEIFERITRDSEGNAEYTTSLSITSAVSPADRCTPPTMPAAPNGSPRQVIQLYDHRRHFAGY